MFVGLMISFLARLCTIYWSYAKTGIEYKILSNRSVGQ